MPMIGILLWLLADRCARLHIRCIAARGICCHFVVGDVVNDIIAGLFRTEFSFCFSPQSIFCHLDLDFVYYSLRKKSKCHHWAQKKFLLSVVCLFFFVSSAAAIKAKYWIISLNWKNLRFDERERSTFWKYQQKKSIQHIVLMRVSNEIKSDGMISNKCFAFILSLWMGISSRSKTKTRRDCAEFGETITWIK